MRYLLVDAGDGQTELAPTEGAERVLLVQLDATFLCCAAKAEIKDLN